LLTIPVLQLVFIVGGKADHRMLSHKLAGAPGRQVALAEVKPRFEQHGDVGPVIDDEQDAAAPAERRDRFGEGEGRAIESGFMTELEDADAGVNERLGRGDQVVTARANRVCVEDRIEPG